MKFVLKKLPFDVILILVLAIVAISCSSPKSKLLGKWVEQKDMVQSFEFFKDKTCVMNIEMTQKSCKWETVDDSRIKIDVEGLVMMSNFEGDNLIVEDTHLGKLVYKKR